MQPPQPLPPSLPPLAEQAAGQCRSVAAAVDNLQARLTATSAEALQDLQRPSASDNSSAAPEVQRVLHKLLTALTKRNFLAHCQDSALLASQDPIDGSGPSRQALDSKLAQMDELRRQLQDALGRTVSCSDTIRQQMHTLHEDANLGLTAIGGLVEAQQDAEARCRRLDADLACQQDQQVRQTEELRRLHAQVGQLQAEKEALQAQATERGRRLLEAQASLEALACQASAHEADPGTVADAAPSMAMSKLQAISLLLQGHAEPCSL